MTIAMIHRMRMEEKRDPVVYGCYSDGVEFTFYRIDHKSRVCLHPSYVPDQPPRIGWILIVYSRCPRQRFVVMNKIRGSTLVYV